MLQSKRGKQYRLEISKWSAKRQNFLLFLMPIIFLLASSIFTNSNFPQRLNPPLILTFNSQILRICDKLGYFECPSKSFFKDEWNWSIPFGICVCTWNCPSILAFCLLLQRYGRTNIYRLQSVCIIAICIDFRIEFSSNCADSHCHWSTFCHSDSIFVGQIAYSSKIIKNPVVKKF